MSIGEKVYTQISVQSFDASRWKGRSTLRVGSEKLLSRRELDGPIEPDFSQSARLRQFQQGFLSTSWRLWMIVPGGVKGSSCTLFLSYILDFSDAHTVDFGIDAVQAGLSQKRTTLVTQQRNHHRDLSVYSPRSHQQNGYSACFHKCWNLFRVLDHASPNKAVSVTSQQPTTCMALMIRS